MPADEYEELKAIEAGGAYHKLVCGSLEFNNDSAVVLPRGLLALSEALAYAKLHPEQRLLVLSHTDGVGTPEFNQKLSQQRAESVLYVLMGGKPGGQPANSTPWGAVARARSVTLDAQMILNWARSFGWARCNPGTLLTDKGADKTAPLPDDSKKAMFWFKAHYKHEFKEGEAPPAQLPTDGSVEAQTIDADFWRAVFHLYVISLSRMLSTQALKLEKLCEAVKYVGDTPATRSVGCGEKYPIEKTAESSQKNRRTEFLFFDEGVEPPAKAKYANLYDPALFTVDPITCMENEIPIDVDVGSKDVVFVIDCSDSMKAYDGRTPQTPANTRLGRCKEALCKAIDELAAGNTTATPRRFNVLHFSDGRGRWHPNYQGNDVPLVACTTDNATRAKTHVNSLATSGATNTHDALELAFKAKGNANEALTDLRIVFFSDGVPTVGVTDTGTILGKVRQWQAGKSWILDTYGFVLGNGGTRLSTFMERLATQNGGVFTPV